METTIYDATRDLTERDIARQNYYRLLGEWAARRIARPEKKWYHVFKKWYHFFK